MDQEPGKHRVQILDPLRGLASISVVWYHFAFASGAIKTSWLRSSGRYGYLGVEIFFVISGFVIPYSMWRGGYHLGHFWRFMVKRLMRLEPPYMASILVAIGAAYLAAAAPGYRGQWPHYSARQLLLHLGYLNTFFGYSWVNPVYWTLGIEFQFYLFAAAVFPLIASRRWMVLVLWIMAAAAMSVRSETLVFHYLGLFGLGIASFAFLVGLMPVGWFALTFLIMTVAAEQSQGFAVAAAGAATALVIVGVKSAAWLRPLAWLGGISYSLYLLHAPLGNRLVNYGARWTHGPASELALLAISTALIVVVSWLFGEAVEWPVQRLASKIIYQRPEDIQPSTI